MKWNDDGELNKGDKTNPLVTVLTVTYNSGRTLARTIESVLNQTYTNIEYIIIDGGSKDKTLEVAESYSDAFQKKNIYFQIISEKDNGMYDALNKGAVMGHGELVGQINSDDWYEKIAVQKMVDLYITTGFDVAFADIRMIRPDGSSWVKKSKIDKYVNTRHWNHPTQFSKRKLLLQHPYPCECMSDDLDLFLWLRSTGKHVEIVNVVLANFTVEGMSHSKECKDMLERIRTKRKIYNRYGYGWSHVVDIVVVELGKFLLEKGS